MYFHSFIDAKGDWLDVVCLPQIVIRFPVTGKGFYSMKGKVVEEFRVYTVEVYSCKKVGIKDRVQKENG
jgi:DNA polymerase-3 subunit alpha